MTPIFRLAAQLAALAVVATAGTACQPVRAERRDERTLAVHRGDFRQILLLSGELAAVERIDILVPRVPNWRTSIRFLAEDGAQVAKGDRILELDNANFLTELEEAKLAVNSAASELVQARAQAATQLAEKAWQVDRSRIELDKARERADIPRGLLSEREYQERQLALQRATSELDKAEESHQAELAAARAEQANRQLELDKARREYDQATTGIANLSFRAPTDGAILVGEHPWEKRKFKVGDMVFVGWTVVSLPDTRAMEVIATLSDVDDGRLEAGMPATVTVDAHPGESFTAAVADVSMLADAPEPQSLRRGFRVRLKLDRTDPERMRPGMSVQVAVETGRRDDALLVPRAALDFDHEPPRVYKAGGEPVPVRLDGCNARDCLLLSSAGGAPELDEGDVLVPPGGRS